jgi:DNA-binding MarR family transcriptional regulator
MPPADLSSPFTKQGARPPLIGALLRVPWEAVRARMLERLHAAGFDDLEPPHLNVLQYPGPDGTRPSELAARLRISKQALNYLLGQLERLGYLGRVGDPDDLRAKRIQVTARGNAAIEVIRAAVREVEREWERAIGPERFALLRGLLGEVASLAVAHPADGSGQ